MNAWKSLAVLKDGQSFEKLVLCQDDRPQESLGPQTIANRPGDVMVRAFLPDAETATIVSSGGRHELPMRRIHAGGIFEVVCDAERFETGLGKYKFKYVQGDTTMTAHDPYAFPPMMGELDLHLFNEGNHSEIHEKLGAHVREVNGVHGVNFAVWAPNAKSICVVGDFNQWKGQRHQMTKLASSGIWELFLPDVSVGDAYKFRVVDFYDQQIDKADPFGFYAELPPRTASVVAELDGYEWGDTAWMTQRESQDPLEQPVSVYEMHLGSWRQDDSRENGWMNYREIAHQLVDYCTQFNFTHIELMPVTEHPYTGSWGYQTVGYFACTSRYGTPEDFMYFVDYCHQHGIGVIIDWVPAHFPKDAHGLAKFDGTALYEHSDPRQGEHPDWDTLIFNYDRNEVRNFLVSNAMFWLEKYHIDGLRVDAVASMLYLDYSRKEGQWIPNKYGGRENLGAIEFLKEMNERVHEKYSGVMTLAEESTAWEGVSRPVKDGGLGFNIKWNMGWMNDTLRYFQKDPIHRKYHHDELTFSLIYAFTENFMLPFSHDEIVHGKGSLLEQMPGDLWQKFANLRLLYGYLWTHPGKKLVFMGCEFGQWNEWNCNSELQWDLLQWDSHQGMQKMVGDLNRIYQAEPALYEVDFADEGFEWIDANNRDASVLGYIRRAKDPDDFILVCCNFTPAVHNDYRLGVPEAGSYQEIFNSDSEYYGGTNLGNGIGLISEKIEAQSRPNSISITIPPMAVTMFKKVN
ncbi:MAG: 1,4-alpha-glucan branching enzyme [Mariniblastus sp.]|jgi:1,4-alpha-glucan branching enzyme